MGLTTAEDRLLKRVPQGGGVARHIDDTEEVADYRLLAAAFDWADYLEEAASRPGSKLLDVGCGRGRWIAALKHYVPEARPHTQRLLYHGLDLSLPSLSLISGLVADAFADASLIRADLRTFALPPFEFDRIWAMHSLYAISPDRICDVVAKLRRCLRPHGIATIVLSESDGFYATAVLETEGGSPFSTAADVRSALMSTETEFQQHNIIYDEVLPAESIEAIARYVSLEAVSNSFPAPDGVVLASEGSNASCAAEWLETYRSNGSYVFPQNAAVISFQGESSRTRRRSRLAPTGAEMRELVSVAAEFVVEEHLDLQGSPVHAGTDLAPPWSRQTSTPVTWADPALAAAVSEGLPERGEDLSVLLQDVLRPLATTGTRDNAPGYVGYIPSGGLFHAALAEWIAASLNRYITLYETAPGLAALESLAVRWLCEAVGVAGSAERAGLQASGLLLSGGSDAAVHAVYAARRATGVAPHHLVAYYAESAHDCVSQALDVCGIGHRRTVGVNNRLQADLDEMSSLISADLDAGLMPFIAIGTAGDVRAGAIDDLVRLRRICDEFELWMHVDASYGGFFAITSRGKELLAGLGDADSLAIDPHKGLGLPYGTGALLVRDEHSLLRAFRADGSYLNASDAATERPTNALDLGVEYTRDFRGLRVWLPLKLLGLAPFRSNLSLMLELADEARRHLEIMDHVELVMDPTLSICLFRLASPCTDDENRALLDAINASGEVFLTGCDLPAALGGGFALRIALLSFRTDRDTLARLLTLIDESASALRLHAR